MKVRGIGAIVFALCVGSCGRSDDQSQGEAIDNNMPAPQIPALGLSPTPGNIKVTTQTFFKTSTASSSDLSNSQKCAVTPGVGIKFVSSSEAGSHIFVDLEKNLPNCGFKSGYFYTQHIEVTYTPVFSVTTAQATKFKAQNKSSAELPANQVCDVSADVKYYLTKAPEEVENNHIKVTLEANQNFNCGFLTGYFYKPHLSMIEGMDLDFNRVMKPILLWEGGCSDNPADPGGRTYMGITTDRARENGWTADVCTMPKTMVLDIYKKDYWLTRPYKFAWPLNLAVMNTEVNSGGGRAQIFLDRMEAQNIQGTLVQKASWFVQQQTNYYYAIADYNPSLRVFLQGWLNRSQYMQDVINGRVAISLDADVISQLRAKAYGPISP